jgi:hypothetical protein
VLLVDRTRLAVDVGLVPVAVEDLQLVADVAAAGGREEEAGVAAGLALAGDVLGRLPFEVELVVPEAALGLVVAGGLHDG